VTDDAALRLYRSLVRRDSAEAISVVERARSEGTSQDVLFDELFAPAMAILGGSWADGSIDEYTFAQAAVVADQVMSFVTPPVAAHDTGATVIVGSMHGDTHDVGKNIIGSALRDAGHRVLDIGTDALPTAFLERAEQSGARILIVCAETLSSALAVTRVREMFEMAGIRGIIVLVWGGPFAADPSLAHAVRADGMIASAEEALQRVSQAVPGRADGASSE
jgi:5-methyltetrahydrofolate--homocysteine methyltransferase